MIPVAIALGANLGEPLVTLRAARAALEKTFRALGSSSPRFSRIWVTEPVGPPQPRYLNAACTLLAPSSLTAPVILEALQSLERAFGRRRAIRWGPRSLDLDLLVVGSTIRSDPWLTLPHPRMVERAFVLLPLEDVMPGLHVVGHGAVSMLARRVDDRGVWPVTTENGGWGCHFPG